MVTAGSQSHQDHDQLFANRACFLTCCHCRFCCGPQCLHAWLLTRKPSWWRSCRNWSESRQKRGRMGKAEEEQKENKTGVGIYWEQQRTEYRKNKPSITCFPKTYWRCGLIDKLSNIKVWENVLFIVWNPYKMLHQKLRASHSCMIKV